MTSRLLLYQGACAVLGQRKVASLIERVPTRYELDGVWNRDGVKTCLQQGLWGFATRTVALSYDSSVTPSFGFRYAFTRPEDFVRLVAISDQPMLRPALQNYHSEGSYFFCDLTEVHLRYVSSDEAYGLDLSLWPPNFTRYTEHYFAHTIFDRITGNRREKQDVKIDMDEWLALAHSTDAAEKSTEKQPQGSWSRARGGSSSRYRGPGYF